MPTARAPQRRVPSNGTVNSHQERSRRRTHAIEIERGHRGCRRRRRTHDGTQRPGQRRHRDRWRRPHRQRRVQQVAEAATPGRRYLALHDRIAARVCVGAEMLPAAAAGRASARTAKCVLQAVQPRREGEQQQQQCCHQCLQRTRPNHGALTIGAFVAPAQGPLCSPGWLRRTVPQRSVTSARAPRRPRAVGSRCAVRARRAPGSRTSTGSRRPAGSP
jgi:hypothetical protein